MGFPARSARRLASLGTGHHLTEAVRSVEQSGQRVQGRRLPFGIAQGTRSFEHAVEIGHGLIETAQGHVGRAAFLQYGRFSLPQIRVPKLRDEAQRVAVMGLPASALAGMLAAWSPAPMKYSTARPNSLPRSKWMASCVAIRGA